MLAALRQSSTLSRILCLTLTLILTLILSLSLDNYITYCTQMTATLLRLNVD